jgi:mannose-6-phosphate isomerase-like protein (cupin superfamily)
MASSSRDAQDSLPAGVRVTPAGSGEVRVLKHGTGVSTRLVEPPPDGDGLVVSRISLEPDVGPKPLHLHRHAQNIYVALEGVLEVRLDTGTERLEPGDSILIPPGRPHATRNPGPSRIEFLALYDRSVADDFVPVPEPGTVDADDA